MSDDKNLGIRLCFSSSKPPELQKLVFECEDGDEQEISNKNGKRLEPGQIGFDWKPRTIGFVMAILQYKLNGRRNEGFYSFKGNRPSSAASACDLIWDEDAWLKDAWNTGPTTNDVSTQIFRARRAKPLEFQIDSNRLFPDRIQVFRGASPDQALSSAEISQLVKEIPWKPHRAAGVLKPLRSLWEKIRGRKSSRN